MSSVVPRPRARSAWVDPRLIVGILVVVASIAGVWFVVAGARQTVPVLVAARTLVAGETIDSGDVRIAEVALGQMSGQYAAAGTTTVGAVAVRTVPAGELIPAAALGPAAAATTTTVVIPSSTALPAAVREGASVEIWSAPLSEEGDVEPPRILVADATVAHVLEEEGLVSAAAVSVEVVVPRADVAAVLAALSDGALLSVVPAVGAAP